MYFYVNSPEYKELLYYRRFQQPARRFSYRAYKRRPLPQGDAKQDSPGAREEIGHDNL